MPSRMNKYYEEDTKSRLTRNDALYKSLYETSDYSNISSVATLEKTNEIDIEKVRQLIKDRENYKKQKEYYDLIKKEEQVKPKQELFLEEEKSYDIKDVLSKAKEERQVDEKEEFLKNKHYDYLLNSQIYNKQREIELNEKEEKLKEIINTITSTIELNKLSNKDLSLNLLDDLKGNTKEIADTSVRKIIEEEKERKAKLDKENSEMDKSFYTSSINFSDKDFDDIIPSKVEKKKTNVLIKVMLLVILLIILAITAYIVIKNI